MNRKQITEFFLDQCHELGIDPWIYKTPEGYFIIQTFQHVKLEWKASGTEYIFGA